MTKPSSVSSPADASKRALANDFCVKADVRGLQPGQRYFYRFLSASDPSPTGLTRTAPRGPTERVNLAVVSCANLPYGYFHAYGHIAQREDIDVVLHLGDYIYEIRRGAYPDAREAVPGRVIDPVGDTVTLSDYYQRYASYHTDPDLLELRRLKPICATWDDHEIANNAWRGGAQVHSERTQGPYADRVAAASKAFHDWLPIRGAAGTPLHRSFDWGDLARILILDTRYIGRDEQLDPQARLYARLTEAGADADAVLARFRRELLDNPNRALLGAEQERWLNQTLAASKRRGQRWQVLAQQVILGDQNFRPRHGPLPARGDQRRLAALGRAQHPHGRAWRGLEHRRLGRLRRGQGTLPRNLCRQRQ